MDRLAPFNSVDVKKTLEKYSPFIKELRQRIIITAIVFCVATIGGFIFYEEIIRFLIELLSLRGVNVVFTSPFQFINLAVSCGLVSGLVFSFPLLIGQILNFLKPALRFKEYQLVVKFLPFCLLLFLAGFAFGALMMKWQIEIFLDQSISLGIGNILDISQLLTTVILTSALMGLGFQFPILLLLLLRLGIVNHRQLSGKRKWVYLISFIFALLLPPDSIVADILLAMPLIILYESTLLIDGRLQKGK